MNQLTVTVTFMSRIARETSVAVNSWTVKKRSRSYNSYWKTKTWKWTRWRCKLNPWATVEARWTIRSSCKCRMKCKVCWCSRCKTCNNSKAVQKISRKWFKLSRIFLRCNRWCKRSNKLNQTSRISTNHRPGKSTWDKMQRSASRQCMTKLHLGRLFQLTRTRRIRCRSSQQTRIRTMGSHCPTASLKCCAKDTFRGRPTSEEVKNEWHIVKTRHSLKESSVKGL